MKNNTFKRVLAGSLALLTVAAYVPANVGGILPDLSIVASAADTRAYNEQDAYKQAGGILKVEEDAKAYIEGVYEISVDAGKYVYTKVATGTTDLNDGKAYILRTTAHVVETNLEPQATDLNGDELADGVYEYKVAHVEKNGVISVETLKTNIKTVLSEGTTTFAEQITVTQNGKEIIYDTNADGGSYVVAQGFPVEIAAKPGEIHTNDMMTVTTDGSTANAAVKSQTKSGDIITLTIVPAKGTTVNGSAVTTTKVAWADYTPTLQLINENGTIKATDVGFEKQITNEVVGKYEFKFGSGSASNFTEGEVNAKGQYIADGKSVGTPTYTPQTVKVGATTKQFTKLGDGDSAKEGIQSVIYEEWDEETQKWKASSAEVAQNVTATTKFRVTTYITSTEFANLTENPFKIVTEFTVVNQAVTSVKNLAFIAPGDDHKDQEIQDKNGVYNVPWQNGAEIEPVLYLFKSEAEKTNAKNWVDDKGTETLEDDEEKPYGDNKDTAASTMGSDHRFIQGSNADYTVTGTTKASEPGTYTMTITPTSKDKFNDGEEITITWQIVNTNNYVTSKKATTKTENAKVADLTSTARDEAVKANAQSFTIGYRQASSKTILQNIIKSLDFVGNTDLTVVEYKKVDKWEVKQGTGNDVDKWIAKPTDGAVVDDPSEKAGYYVAYVANALKNDGKTSAMMKDNDTYNGGALYPVYFQVTPTKVRIVPKVTEITYGDDVEISKLYTVIDGDTKETIGVPWGNAPIFQLTGKYGETTQDTNGKVSTKQLAAGEYTYKVSNTAEGADKVSVLDPDNYDVSQLLSEDKIDFTVNPRDLSDIDFGSVRVKVNEGDKNVEVTKGFLALAANAIDANPAQFKITDGDTADFRISGGTTSAKATALGQTFTVNLKGVGNFTGTKAVQWIVGDTVLSDKVMTYEAEFDASKPRVMAKFDITKVDGEIEECGFYYNNNGKMNGLTDTEAKAAFEEVDKTGSNMNQKGSKKVGFSAKALATAKSGNGLLTAEIANSSVKKQVYIMPYVKYTNGNVAYGEVENFNYYDMVLNAEGALEVTKTDVVGTGTKNDDGVVLTKDKTYVKVDVTRVNKKGYEVERYGILYNNSNSWDKGAESVYDNVNGERALADRWLNIDYESEKTVKVAEVDKTSSIGTYTYIANTTAKENKGEKNEKDLGYGEKTVFAKAFIKIKDAAGNEQVYYSHLADVTYGGFTESATTGRINDGSGYMDGATEKHTTLTTDSKNKTQIEFFAPDGGAMIRMAASTGDTTFAKWWEDQQKNK